MTGILIIQLKKLILNILNIHITTSTMMVYTLTPMKVLKSLMKSVQIMELSIFMLTIMQYQDKVVNLITTKFFLFKCDKRLSFKFCYMNSLFLFESFMSVQLLVCC